MTTLELAGRTGSGIALVPIRNGLWRVTRPDGQVLGYVEAFTAPHGERYRAKRLIARQRRFLVDGEFWTMADAVDCLRVG
jgi:hypothetical protein